MVAGRMDAEWIRLNVVGTEAAVSCCTCILLHGGCPEPVALRLSRLSLSTQYKANSRRSYKHEGERQYHRSSTPSSAGAAGAATTRHAHWGCLDHIYIYIYIYIYIITSTNVRLQRTSMFAQSYIPAAIGFSPIPGIPGIEETAVPGTWYVVPISFFERVYFTVKCSGVND